MTELYAFLMGVTTGGAAVTWALSYAALRGRQASK